MGQGYRHRSDVAAASPHRPTKRHGVAVFTRAIHHQTDNVGQLWYAVLLPHGLAQKPVWNPLLAKIAPLNYYEDICVFTHKPMEMHQHHPLRDYFLSELARSKFTKPQINKLLGNSMSSHYFTQGIQFVVPSAKDYAKLQTTGFWPLPYAELQLQHQKHKADFKQRYPRVFNLPAGKGHKSNVFTYAKDVPSLHPTQKPAALLADLIQTYSHAGDTVLDFTMGSGSTGQACQQTGRHFIGIEKDDHYFGVAASRLITKSK